MQHSILFSNWFAASTEQPPETISKPKVCACPAQAAIVKITEAQIQQLHGGEDALAEFNQNKPEPILQLLKEHPAIITDRVTETMFKGIMAKSPQGHTYFLRFDGQITSPEATALATSNKKRKEAPADNEVKSAPAVKPQLLGFMVLPTATEPGGVPPLSPSPQDPEIDVPIFLDDEAVRAVREVLKRKQVRRGCYPIEFDRTRGF